LAATQARSHPGPDRLVVDRWISQDRPDRLVREELQSPTPLWPAPPAHSPSPSPPPCAYLVGVFTGCVRSSPIKVTSLSRAVSTSDSLPAAAPALARTQRIFLNLTDRQSVAAVVCWLRTCSPAHGSCRGCPACEPPPSGTHSSFCAPLPLFGCLVG
jgi:hypothetical protein